MSDMFFPDDILGLIHKFSRPYRTRPDWRSCKRIESWCIEQFFEWHEFLLTELAWFVIRNEYGDQVFQDMDAVTDFLHDSKMVSRLLRFEAQMPLELDRMDLMYVWFERNFALGIAALPVD
jgi:hypothetical protein